MSKEKNRQWPALALLIIGLALSVAACFYLIEQCGKVLNTLQALP